MTSRPVKAVTGIVLGMGMVLLGAKAIARSGSLSGDFMPHGYCYMWNPGLVWLHVTSDLLIALSYYCIPIILVCFIRKNRALPFNRIFAMFGIFILACGTTHLLEVWNVWHASYLLAGIVKAATATVSVLTAAMLVPLIPRIIALPELIELQAANRHLERQIEERKRFDAPIDIPLLRKITIGFAAALVLTAFLGFSAWRSTQRSRQDAFWISHTYEVMGTLQRTTRHTIEAVASARAFSMTGRETLLARYESAREAMQEDAATLQRLTADNPDQQQRANELEPQMRATLDFADGMIANRRQSTSHSDSSDALEIERRMDVVRAACFAMTAEEVRLLGERTQALESEQWRARTVAITGAVLGVGLWVMAWLAVKREIGISRRAQTQLHRLNAELEERVEQRTGALQSEIAERKRAEHRLSARSEELLRSQQDLEDQKRMLQSVLDSMTEGLIASDAKGEFLLWNPAARNIIGMDAASVPPNEWSQHYGIFMEDMLTPFPDEQYPLVRAAKGDANTTVMYLQNSKLDAGVWIEVSASPLRDKHGQACGGVAAFRNITQRRLDEQKIRKLNEELEERVIQRTAQLEAINRELEAFTYSVSHDLRAPLRHIAGFSRILVEDFSANLASEAKDHLRRIETGVHRMGLLVDELLNLSRVGRHSVRLQPADLNFIIEEVKALLQSEAADRTVNWKIAILPEVTCDPILIKQVFQNLMANALKFTRPRPQAVIDISHHLKDGQIVIAVSDNGVGFNMKYQDKLFGVFQRLHSAKDFEGTGIGLVTVQRIVHKHGGQVWAESEVDKGATFFFTLPASEPALIKPQPASLPVLATLQESKTAAAGAKA